MTTAYEELVSVLYDEENRAALEWAIGSIFQNGPKKTVVLYGHARTGKTTMLQIIDALFPQESIFLSIRLGDHFDRTTAIEVRGHQFMECNQPPNIEELQAMPDMILVSTSGRMHTPSRYQQLVSEIYENPDEPQLIFQACTHRFASLGPTHYDHVISNHIPEENTQ
jgi:energy-coupling factor transporter ATP-binding protein EcfA2